MKRKTRSTKRAAIAQVRRIRDTIDCYYADWTQRVHIWNKTGVGPTAILAPVSHTPIKERTR